MGAIDPGGGLDLIGDIHGHASALDRLLDELGYETIDGVRRHRKRTAVFLGDYIDRGPEIEVLHPDLAEQQFLHALSETFPAIGIELEAAG